MSFLSLLPNVISGVGSFISDVAQGKDVGEAALGGLKTGLGVPNAADALPSDAEMEKYKSMPMERVQVLKSGLGGPVRELEMVPKFEEGEEMHPEAYSEGPMSDELKAAIAEDDKADKAIEEFIKTKPDNVAARLTNEVDELVKKTEDRIGSLSATDWNRMAAKAKWDWLNSKQRETDVDDEDELRKLRRQLRKCREKKRRYKKRN